MGRRNKLSTTAKIALRDLREKSNQPPPRHHHPAPGSNIGLLQHDPQGFFVSGDKGRVNITNAEEAGYKPKHCEDAKYRVGYDTRGASFGSDSVQFSGEIGPEYFKPVLDQRVAQAKFAQEQGNPKFSTALDWIQEYAEQYKSQIDTLMHGLPLSVDMNTIRDRSSRLEKRLPLIDYHLRDRSDGSELSEANRITLGRLKGLLGEYRAILDLEERVNADDNLRVEINTRIEQMVQIYYQIHSSPSYYAVIAAKVENEGGRGATLTKENITQAISLLPQIKAALGQVGPREISVCGPQVVPAYEELKLMQQILATNRTILERRAANGEIKLLEMPPDTRIAENFIRGYFQYFNYVMREGIGSFYESWGSKSRTKMSDYKKLDKALGVIEHHGGKTIGGTLGQNLSRLYSLWDGYRSELGIPVQSR